MSRIIAFLSDETALHQAIASWLEGRAQVFSSFEKLQKFLKGERVECVILEAQYEAVSGFYMAENIKTQYPDTRIIILSNSVSIGLFEKAQYAGIDHILEAPFSPAELEALLWD